MSSQFKITLAGDRDEKTKLISEVDAKSSSPAISSSKLFALIYGAPKKNYYQHSFIFLLIFLPISFIVQLIQEKLDS